MKKTNNLLRLLVVLLMTPLFGCRTVTIREVTRTVVPEYTFPTKPEFPMDLEKLSDGRYAINGEYFKSLETYFVLIDALEEEYNIDKEGYDELNRNSEKDGQP